MKSFRNWMFATSCLFGSVGLVHAGPTLVFSFTETDVSQFPDPAGTVTLTQNGSNSVDVLVDLPTGFGFLNTGGPHTPFAFNLAGTLSLVFTAPAGGSFVPAGGGTRTFTYNSAGGGGDTLRKFLSGYRHPARG